MCPSCHGLNLSCPYGCGRDPLIGELNGTRYEDPQNRERLLHDLRVLLAFTELGGWGMDALRNIIPRLIPDFPDGGKSTIAE